MESPQMKLFNKVIYYLKKINYYDQCRILYNNLYKVIYIPILFSFSLLDQKGNKARKHYYGVPAIKPLPDESFTTTVKDHKSFFHYIKQISMIPIEKRYWSDAIDENFLNETI